ncbi:molybdenum cofactor guanylyltransferase [Thiomicrospira cyclica]|uniref:Molybdenum cofactor guanylyltransferase n=1 Tax=Thiomicrospira cyclica (strain DSM 14477 / JCM 11371 / ALM1) TaxID=717773 RepID=F6DCH4_THICA|nr:NTP transferase domain-containing protein [Thiomicrospira cyclica]AEG31560.1 Molybdopterin-guanine dinucleotide biosynthesis protein A [Thiomicrospira cyclica ALM1]
MISNSVSRPARIGVVILAGGRGQRMGGQDKGWIEYQGRYLIERLLADVQAEFDGPVVISANRNLSRYHQLGCPVIADSEVMALDYAGPLVGLLGGMESGLADNWVCWPVDVPSVPTNYFKDLQNLVAQYQPQLVQSFYQGQLEPLHLAVASELSAELRDYLQSGGRAVKIWSNAMVANYPQHSIQHNVTGTAPINLNNLADLATISDQDRIAG